MTGGLPPLQVMVGRYIGYEMKKPEATEEQRSLSQEEHAARLIGALTGGN